VNPPETSEKDPLIGILVPSLSTSVPVNFPFDCIVIVSLPHQGASGPVVISFKFHVPAKSASEAPKAADENTGNKQIKQMKMNSLYRSFERFALRISGPPW
jgi:hypothetical protein